MTIVPDGKKSAAFPNIAAAILADDAGDLRRNIVPTSARAMAVS